MDSIPKAFRECPKCGFDLAASWHGHAAQCPECGAELTRASVLRSYLMLLWRRDIRVVVICAAIAAALAGLILLGMLIGVIT